MQVKKQEGPYKTTKQLKPRLDSYQNQYKYTNITLPKSYHLENLSFPLHPRQLYSLFV